MRTLAHIAPFEAIGLEQCSPTVPLLNIHRGCHARGARDEGYAARALHSLMAKGASRGNMVRTINSRPKDTGDRPRSDSPDPAPILFAVDDDPSTLALLCDIAEDAGWVAQPFTRLHEMRTTLDEVRPSLLILDDNLPDGRGGDLARDLRADPRMKDVPLLVCTAAHPVRRAEIGAWAPVVAKPFDLDEIERFLHAASRHRGVPLDHAAG